MPTSDIKICLYIRSEGLLRQALQLLHVRIVYILTYMKMKRWIGIGLVYLPVTLYIIYK